MPRVLLLDLHLPEMDVRIGTAGYSYRPWVGSFYPPGTASHAMLPFYARHFLIVEINSSFYRPPTPDQLEAMARRVPSGFGFTLKIPRTVSHGRSLDDLPAFKQAADRLSGSGKLLGLLFQVPESFHNTVSNREWLIKVKAELNPHRVAVEFRHRSWNVVNLTEWLEYVGLDLVSVGVPNLPELFPRGLRIANRRAYVRLHSQNAANWYKSGALRYKFDYSDALLREWAKSLTLAAKENRADDCLFIFNNCVGMEAIQNARRLAELLKKSEPMVRVVEPAPAPEPPSLFDALP